MEWYVFSDLNYLADVVNGVAGIMGNVGSATQDDYTGMLATVLLLGVITTAARSLMAGHGIQLSALLVSIMVWGIAFVPKVDVTMENVYTGQTRTVANVPVGIGFIGQLFSTIGLSLAETAETAYSVPGITDEGYADALEDWATLRRTASFPGRYAAANGVGGGDFRRSWVSYVSTCTNFGLELGAIQRSALSSAPLVHEALALDFESYGAAIYVGGGVESSLSCAEAHEQLLMYSREQFIPALKAQVLVPLMHDPARESVASVANLDSELTALFSLFNAGVATDEALLSLFVGPLVDHGNMRRLQLDMKEGYAVMLADSIRQRNAQWSAQGEIFQVYARPLISFIEGFFYAMAPFVLIATMLGAVGFGIVKNYCLIGLWIQLWAPVLAVINLFVLHTVSGEITGLSDSGIPFTSLGGQFSADDVVQQYRGVAGLFASSVPPLAFLLLSGSAYAFTGIANRVGSPDTIDEKLAAPSTVGSAPFAQKMPNLDMEPIAGQVVRGSRDLLPNFNMNLTRGAEMRAAETRMQGEREQLTDAFSRSLATSSGSDTRSSRGILWSDREAAENSALYGVSGSESFARANELGQQFGLTESQTRSYIAQAGLTGGISSSAGRGGTASGGNGVGVSGGVNASGAGRQISDTTLSDNQRASLDRSIRDALQSDDSLRASMTSALARDISQGLTRSGYNSSAFTQTEQLSREASEFRAAEQSVARSRSILASVGLSSTSDAQTIANWVVSNGQFGDFNSLMHLHGLAGRSSRLAETWRNSGFYGSSPTERQQAYVHAGLTQLHSEGKLQAFTDAITPSGLYVPGLGGTAADMEREMAIRSGEIRIRSFDSPDAPGPVGGADWSAGAAPIDPVTGRPRDIGLEHAYERGALSATGRFAYREREQESDSRALASARAS
ncbi:MAG: conjugal transfer protein TraG N-terminal domain-containing protein, partial [Pseudomonadota bacterium]